MHIDKPSQAQIPGLRWLWQEAFGDPDAFLNVFFDRVFSPERCRCIFDGADAAAAAYWLDCQYDGRKLAYLYAVATAPDHRNRGLCRMLMTQIHEILQAQGYAGAILVPGTPDLFAMYEKMGYQVMSGMDTLPAGGSEAAALQALTPEEYAVLRRQYLPAGGVIQEGESLLLLHTCAGLYAGKDFLLAARVEDGAVLGLELLGDCAQAAGIPAALGVSSGCFRVPGKTPFAMYHPLSDSPVPTYFGLAFD